MSLIIPENSHDPEFPELGRSVNMYGVNYIIRKLTGWPDCEPLPFSIQHAYSVSVDWSPMLDVRANPLRNFWVYGDREYNYYVNSYFGSNFLWKCGHPCTYLTVPFYNRKGTVAMPYHVNRHIDHVGMDEYFKTLVQLPEKYHPITVCLHNHDIDLVGICEQYGLKCVSAGRPRNMFYERLLDILAQHEYMTTNYSGTALWASLYAGCKPFYFNQPAEFVQKSDGKRIVSRVLYQNLFRINNVDEFLDEKRDLLEIAFGLKYRKTADELRSLLDKWSQDDLFRMWRAVWLKFGKDRLRFCDDVYSNRLDENDSVPSSESEWKKDKFWHLADFGV